MVNKKNQVALARRVQAVDLSLGSIRSQNRPSVNPAVLKFRRASRRASSVDLNGISQWYPTTLGVGKSVTLTFDLPTYMNQDEIDRYDQYRFRSIRVWAEMAPVAGITPTSTGFYPRGIVLNVFSCVDLDDSAVEDLGDLQRRSNVRLVSLHATSPTASVVEFSPRVIYDHTAGGPATRIPTAGDWFDTAAATQEWGSVKLRVESNFNNETPSEPLRINFYSEAQIEFKYRK